MAFDVFFSTGFDKQTNWNFSFLAINFSSMQKAERNLHFSQPACADIYFFVKTKLLFTSWVGRFSLFFLYLHQIYTFNDNFNDEETLIFHLMRYLNYSTL